MIRDAVEADLERIVEIYNAAIPGRRATADTAPVSVDTRRSWFRARFVFAMGYLPGVALLDGVARDLLILGKRLPASG